MSALIAGIGEARYVIITDISVEYAYPSNEPQGFSVKWKYADSRQQWYADVVAQIKELERTPVDVVNLALVGAKVIV